MYKLSYLSGCVEVGSDSTALLIILQRCSMHTRSYKFFILTLRFDTLHNLLPDRLIYNWVSFKIIKYPIKSQPDAIF